MLHSPPHKFVHQSNGEDGNDFYVDLLQQVV